MQIVHINLPVKLYRQITKLAKQLDMSRSAYIRRVLRKTFK